jgi:diguanylate cyclase (GGDEF)-like protein/PAS domain S-box-containing protein
MKNSSIKVLLIEDDEDDYIITRNLFAEIDGREFQLEWVTTYDEAIAKLARQHHDICLVDYRLGQWSGLDLLRTAVVNGCDTPMILLTGQGDREVDVAAMRAGAADYLVKGEISARILERSIRYALERTRTLAELRQTLREKSQLALAISNITTGVLITDPNLSDNPVIFVNPAFTTSTGYSAVEIIGKNWRFLHGPETDPETLSQIDRAIVEQQPISCTVLNYRKNGIPFWNELTINPVFDEHGKLINFIGLQTDVTDRKQAEETLERLRHRHELILNSAGEGIYGVDLQGNATFVNPAAARMVGWDVAELLGQPINAMVRRSALYLVHSAADTPDTVNTANTANTTNTANIDECPTPVTLAEAAVSSGDVDMFWRKDGTSFPAEYISTPIWENGQLVGTVVTFQDITERQCNEEALRESEERYALAVQGANDGIWDWNLKTGKVYFSPRWKAMLGYAEHEIDNSLDEWFERVHPEDLYWVKREVTAHLDGLTPHFESEHRMLHRDGEYRWMLSRGLAVRDLEGRATRMAGSQTDVTGWKRAEEKLVHDALHDTLTDLPNRVLLMERLRHAVQLSQRSNEFLFAVLFIDLDRFKVINDSLGHMLGDQLLIAIAQRLSKCLRPSDTVARLGGDEFVILLEDVKDTNSVIVVADRIQRELTLPFNLEGHEIFTAASLGIAFSTTGYNRPEDLLRDADTAMYRAKAQGRSRYEIFHPGMHAHAVALLQLETDLRRAIDRQELHLHYQPIVSLRTYQVIGFEALLRWQHPQRGMVSPVDFIPIAEETGLITSIGCWVLREACQQMQQWHQQFPKQRSMTIQVNLSGKQFTPQLAEQADQILQEVGLDAHCLKLELTESILMENAESAVTTLAQLKQLGIQLAIDDFGTGYSSLSYLHRFPIDTLKIDRSFIAKVDADGEQLAIVRTIMTLAWNLGMEVVAEGVETMKQLAQLRALKCECAQGYLFSVPLSADAATQLVEHGLSEWQANGFQVGG